MSTTSPSSGTRQVMATVDTREVGPDGVRDPVLHHVNLRTPRMEEMIAWYGRAVGMRPTFASSSISFLTNDHANHRLALLTSAGVTDDPASTITPASTTWPSSSPACKISWAATRR